VFVATSGGNPVPDAGARRASARVAHQPVAGHGGQLDPQPPAADAILGNGSRLEGASSNANTPAAADLLARCGPGGRAPTDVNLLRCYGAADATSAYLDPAKVQGKVLVCDRGGNVLVNKSANGKTAGAAGVIIANVAGGANTIINQAHVLSTVHLAQAQGDALKAYMAANPDGTAALGEVHTVPDTSVGAHRQRPFLARAERGQCEHPEAGPVGAGHQRAGRRDADLTQAQRDAVAAGGGAGGRVGFLFRHLDGQPARGRRGGAAQAAASRLVARGHQVGADDDGLQHVFRRLERFRVVGCHGEDVGPAAVGPGRRPHRAEQRGRSGLVYDLSEIDYARFLCGLNLKVYSAATCRPSAPSPPTT
jgi:hypothetical protein